MRAKGPDAYVVKGEKVVRKASGCHRPTLEHFHRPGELAVAAFGCKSEFE